MAEDKKPQSENQEQNVSEMKPDIKEYVEDDHELNTSRKSTGELEETFDSPILEPVSVDTDLMIENLTPYEAREYVIAWLQEEKRLKRLIAEHDAEIRKWENRVTLASEKGKEDLVQQASNKITELKNKKIKFESDLSDICAKSDILKEKLANMPKDLHTVDTDFLLMNIEHLVGQTIEEMTTDTIFDKLDSQKTLEELKKKMNKK